MPLLVRINFKTAMVAQAVFQVMRLCRKAAGGLGGLCRVTGQAPTRPAGGEEEAQA